MREQAGRPLPDYVEEEFEAFLDCGRLEQGFLRLRCEQCHAEKLVAFSCKKRGFCPSCGARRMAETAAMIGMQIVGNYFDEARMLALARAFQRATDWHSRMPPAFV